MYLVKFHLEFLNEGTTFENAPLNCNAFQQTQSPPEFPMSVSVRWANAFGTQTRSVSDQSILYLEGAIGLIYSVIATTTASGDYTITGTGDFERVDAQGGFNHTVSGFQSGFSGNSIDFTVYDGDAPREDDPDGPAEVQ